MTATVLFLCPHHAAKSVIATAYFNRLAQRQGLSITADSAGTDPAEAVSPAVVEVLRGENIDVSGLQPRRVTPSDLAQAEHIISMGCTSDELGIAPERVEQWSDIPLVSQNITEACEAIRVHVENLVIRLRDSLIVGNK